LQEEEDNLLPPGSFFPLAEDCGMLANIDRWVVGKVIERCRERKLADRGWPMPLYWINLSAPALRSPDFARSVQRQLEAEDFDGRHLCFEIDEGDFLAHRGEVQRLMDALRPGGCRFAIDGYGAAEPRLDIHDLGIDFVKINGAIVQNLLRDAAHLASARAIHGACRQHKISTVAEMVEDPATLTALRAIGVDYAQGFGIARPEPLFAQPLALANAA
jgi:EAL domain-containing protein (putative c-di-GMP-specific phosphodiesterase class I)